MRVLLALSLFAVPALADSAGKYGNGRTQPRVTVETRIITTQNQLQVKFTHDGESSGWRNASEDPDGDGRDAWDSAESGDLDGERFRFKDGECQYRNENGDWIDIGRKRKGNPVPGSVQHLTAGTVVPRDGMARFDLPGSRWFPVTAGSSYFVDIYYIPGGDDVTTLPDDPDYD